MIKVADNASSDLDSILGQVSELFCKFTLLNSSN